MKYISSGKILLWYLVLPVLILLVTETYHAQTVIKEKITLTPQNQLRTIQNVQDHNSWWPCTPPAKTYDYYNPLQAVWMYSSFPLNPGRQALRSHYGYGVDTSKYYTFKIISGGNYFYFQRNYFDGYDWITDIIRDSIRVKGKDLWPIEWDDKNKVFITVYDSIRYLDKDLAPFYNCCYNYQYTIHFDGIRNREQEVVYSVTEDTTYYVHTFIKRPTYTFSTNNDQDTLLHGLDRTIPIKLEINECPNDSLYFLPRNGGSLNDDVQFSVRITEGAEFGDLLIDYENYGDEATVDYYTLGGGFYFVTKEGENPDSVALVKIEITCYDGDVNPNMVSCEFPIKHNSNPPPGLLLTFDKSVLMPFDSTRIYLQFVTDDGEILDFSPYYSFNLRIEEGSDYGILYSEMWDYYSTELYDESASGLWFYSTQDIPINMVDIVIHAEESGGIIAGKINPDDTTNINTIKQLKN